MTSATETLPVSELDWSALDPEKVAYYQEVWAAGIDQGSVDLVAKKYPAPGFAPVRGRRGTVDVRDLEAACEAHDTVADRYRRAKQALARAQEDRDAAKAELDVSVGERNQAILAAHLDGAPSSLIGRIANLSSVRVQQICAAQK